MNEIEKLYINAGIKKEWKPLPYGDIEEYYPEFSIEKQLELIKWLIIKHSLEINKGRYTTYYMCNRKKYTSSSDNDFTMCLAKLMNKIWQDLTDTEKTEVKRILK